MQGRARHLIRDETSFSSPEVDLYDVRMYVGEDWGVLSQNDVRSLALEAGRLGADSRCQSSTLDSLADSGEWADAFGHSCTWYFEQAKRAPQVCQVMAGKGECMMDRKGVR